MPTYLYKCPIHNEFEESHSIKEKLELCPKCKEEGRDRKIERLINCTSVGVVELSGDELIKKIKSDAKALQREAKKDAKIYANLLGESRYETLQKQMDRRGK